MAKSISERVAENLTKGKVKKKKHSNGEGMSAAKASKTSDKPAKEKKAPKEVNEVGQKIGTIMATIYSKLNEKKGATKEEIMEALKAAFPEKDAEGMGRTLNIQLQRMPKEKGFRLKRHSKTNRYYIIERGLEPVKNGLKKTADEKAAETSAKVKVKKKKSKAAVEDVVGDDDDE